MGCLHPLRAFPTGAYSDKGKPVYFVTSHKFSYATVDDFVKRGLPYKDLYVDDYIEIPCGKCVACRKHKQLAWAFRCLAESHEHKFNYFITLTYDDAHLPEDLKKRDLQLFNKRLRKVAPFRFFACGEYGDINKRPHYHGLYFSDSELFPDLVPWAHKGNYNLYNSAVLSRIWPFGFAVIGYVSPSSCAYCAKYCLKSSDQDPNKSAPFIIMSRAPGLGDAFFEANLSSSRLVQPTGEGRALFGGLPRYVKEKHGISTVFDSSLYDFAKMRDLGISDLEDFRFLEDYLLKHPALVYLR